MNSKQSLLDEIESEATDSSGDILKALRKCISLGGASGSEALREWASRELKGYSNDDELPAYRRVPAAICVSGQSGNWLINHQRISPSSLPEGPRSVIKEEVALYSPLSELVHMVDAAEGGQVKLALPGSPEIVTMMNYEIEQNDNSFIGPNQNVNNVFWSIPVGNLRSSIDCVRTAVVELVAELRAGLEVADAIPSAELANQAVNIAVHGKGNRVSVVNPTVTGSGSIENRLGEEEGILRKWMWWLVGIAGVVGAIAGVLALFH